MERPFAITLDVGSSHANRTGSWRVERPVYVDRHPPCSGACPAGEDVRGWLYHAESGDYHEAWRLLVEANPLPAVMGRICFHPCETACNRGELDEAVGINSVERFLGDLARRERWPLPEPAPPTGSRVLVVGSGPAGLGAAYHLRRLGHGVHLVDGAPRAGGMMRYGIPAYRLPRDVLDDEIGRIVDLGVELELGRTVTDVRAERSAGSYDAVFLAVGAQLARRIEIPAGDSSRVLDALSLLHRVADDEPPRLGRHVVVYGGGDTAVDAARTARRLGATDAVIVYRRNRARMPAQSEELDAALAEGVTVRWLSTVDSFADGRMRVERMEADGDGMPRPTGEFDELDADSLVLALGQDTDLSLLGADTALSAEDGVLTLTDAMMTSEPGIFAGGDATPSPRTATVAIGHGARAARGIDAYLSGRPLAEPVVGEPATFERLNTWYFSDAPRTRRPELERVRRQTTFDEVITGLTEENALFEARRCLSCGSCFSCDNCFAVCPDNAVLKLGGPDAYAFDYEYCKGCGICVHECPCGAIEMVPEQI
ncbi:MAG TPA: NAD(P)-binding protein [Acidimicrobiales bacterium]|nr:NAD(P)-binding protein [Acidimicrobiales bacterium]